MGGEGSGRKPDIANRILREVRQPIVTQGSEGLFLPNYSGIKDAVRKDSFGTKKLEIGKSQLVTVGNVSSINATYIQDDSTLQLYSDGYNYSFYIYAYKTVEGVRVYSANPNQIDLYDNALGEYFHIDLSWSSVDGASGYVIEIIDEYTGIYGEYCLDVTTTSATYDGLISNGLTTTPALTPTSPYTVYAEYLHIIGDATIDDELSVGGNLNVSSITANASPLNIYGGVLTDSYLRAGSTAGGIGFDPRSGLSSPSLTYMYYGMFAHSGVGLGFFSGAGGTNQGISFWNYSGSSFYQTMSILNSGVKLPQTSSLKLGMWGATPIVQPTTSVGTATFTANAGTAVNDASTFDGYTLKQVIKALRNIGILA